MFTVMTWNVQNLFLPGTEGGPKTPAEYEAKLDALAEVINGAAPDVVGLQEVGEPEALTDLTTHLGGTWDAHVSQHPDQRGIRVAVLSRVPATTVEDVVALAAGLSPPQVEDQGDPMTEMGRGALRVTLDLPGGATIHVVVTHLKSKLITYAENRFSPLNEDERARYGGFALNRRTAEAVTVRVHVNGLLGGGGREQALVLLGDMNDEPQAATTQILAGPGGSELDTPGGLRPDAGDGDRLFNLAPLLPAAQRYSRIYNGRRELIDHLFVTRALVERVSHVASLVGGLRSITDDPGETPDISPSDHAPIVANLSV
jgi:endonuclease/exonuclease/phosphatase family metal-dependent hydrolase